MRTTAFLVAVLLSGLTSAANAKGGGSKIQVIVPDTGNNRVLIYNAPRTNGAPANAVLGQGDFGSSTPGATATGMSSPSAFTVDKSGQLIVSDTGNCRVLVFKPPFATGKAAAAVIGKPDFTTVCETIEVPFPPYTAPGGDTPSQTRLGNTGGLAVDKRGGLWVADTSNNRLLHFKAPLKTGMAADMVIGQPDFDTGTCVIPPSNATLCGPVGLALDASGILWVADRGNSRMLGFGSPATQPGADVVLGPLSSPAGVAAGQKSALWVADSGNNRVLMYQIDSRAVLASRLGIPPELLGISLAPQVVLGQDNSVLITPDIVASAASLSGPQGVAIAQDGSVWVGDTINNRTLKFVAPFESGMEASLVLGQPDFGSVLGDQGNPSPSESTQDMPFNTIEPIDAGPSPLAIAVLLFLSGAWLMMRRLRPQKA